MLRLARWSGFRFEYLPFWMEPSKPFFLYANLFYNQAHLTHIFFRMKGLVVSFRKVHIALLCDGRTLGKDMVDKFPQQFLCFWNISKLHEAFLRYIPFHILVFHSSSEDLWLTISLDFFDHFQYKFYHSLLQLPRKPSKIHMCFDL